MMVWSTVQQHLCAGLVDFMSQALPSIGGERWWQNNVLLQLSPIQLGVVESIEAGALDQLDLAALLRVAQKNGSELAFKFPSFKGARPLFEELKDARNRHAHAPAKGLPLEDVLRDVDTVRKFLTAIDAAPQSLGEISKVRKDLLRRLADESDDDTPPSGNTSAGGTSTTPDSPDEPQGPESGNGKDPMGGGWLIDPESAGKAIREVLAANTFVGIDFGTSTSVVSVITLDNDGGLHAKTLDIAQPDEYGGDSLHHLVNTVLAWHKNQLLFGNDAYRLRQQLFEGRTVFSSFKMRLGVDIGPTYPETTLRKGEYAVTVESANDATREFFKLLALGIKDAVALAGLPSHLRFAVTVPASFEANQRRDLLRNMKDAGLPVTDSALIDEPNAAFLSYLHQSARAPVNDPILERLRHGAANILVYDFGAGTCDVSILTVQTTDGAVRSRNRAISRFTALGGDDIDRAIAKNCLLSQLLESAPDFEPETRDVEDRLVPRLQPTAEKLKIAAIKWCIQRGISTLDELREQTIEFTDLPLPPFAIRKHRLTLDVPTMPLSELADALEPFVGRYDEDESSTHVFAPIADALDKSGLAAEDLHAVLFIGGSAENPIVREAVMRLLPPEVRAIVPPDLRSHVSLGAALHSLGFHGLSADLIRPITSETIYVITRGGRLETVIPASSEVPTPDAFTTRLRVSRAGQQVVELPFCVSNESKLLGLLTVESSRAQGFREGDEVIISARITREKLLDVTARIGDQNAGTKLMNPLANQELSPAETGMLEAKQKFNIALLEHHGRPPVDVVLAYAMAAGAAGAHEIAAEMYQSVERLQPDANWATSICYHYSRADRAAKSHEWAKKAYERKPDALTAYNLSCDETGERREELLREALQYNPKLGCALLALGRLLRARRDADGQQLLERCVSVLEPRLDAHTLSESDCHYLAAAATELGKTVTAVKAQARLSTMSQDSAFDEENLAASIVETTVVKGI